MRTNMKSCNRNGMVGEAPSKEEFCIAYRAQKLADQYKCPLMKYTEEYLRTNDLEPKDREVIKESMKHLDTMAGGKGNCGNNKTPMMKSDVPIIWRKHMGAIVKGTFCELDGEWYWEKVATCGCKSCGGGSMNDDWVDKDWKDDMGDNYDAINFGR